MAKIAYVPRVFSEVSHHHQTANAICDKCAADDCDHVAAAVLPVRGAGRAPNTQENYKKLSGVNDARLAG